MSDTKKIFKVTEVIEFKDDLSKVKKWKNMIVDIFGASHLGDIIYDTQEAAETNMKAQLGRARRLTNLRTDVDIFDYAWHTQIPVEE